jgi:HlyD family secretion protein
MELKAKLKKGAENFLKDFKDKSPEAAARRKHKIKKIVLCIVGVFVLIWAVTNLYKRIEYGKSIKVSGNIEGNEVRISFRVAGLIEELIADEGWLLKTGDVLARLDKTPLISQRDEAAAALKLAKSQYELDKLDYVRAENLFTEGAISAQQRDAAKTKSDNDKADIERLTASLELAELNLNWANLTSPLNGYITVKSALQGENVLIGAPVFTAIDMNDIWVSAYVDEKDLGRIKLNQKAVVKIDAYPFRRYKGWISFISQQTEFTPKYIQTTKERVKYVYRIKVKCDNSSLDLKPGMPADAYIRLD